MAATGNKHRNASRTGLTGVCSALLTLIASPAQALDWRAEPNVGAQVTLTDNVGQRSSGKESALIVGVTPGINLESYGSRRVRASLQYGLSAVSRFGGDSSSDIYHRLNASGKAEVIEDLLFVEGRANVSQELISLLGSGADATTNDSNRTTVGTYLISPYLKKRFGSFATSELRYTASGAIFQNNTGNTSNVNAISANVTSGPRFNDLLWSFDYSLRKAEINNAQDTTFESVSATLGYSLTRKFRLFGTVGQDSNDYLSTTSTDGSFYNLGFQWAPSRRTSFEASAGERYFGKTFALAANHRTRASAWNIRYSEGVSDITQQFLEQTSRLAYYCPLQNALFIATDQLQPVPAGCIGPYTAVQLANANVLTAAQLQQLGLTQTATASGVYLLKNLIAGASWTHGRFGIGGSVYDTKREYQLFGGAADHIQGVSGSVSYRLTPKTTANTTLSLSRNTFDAALNGGVPRDDDIYSLTLGLSHRFSQDFNGTLAIRRTQRESTVPNASYDENSIAATANMRF